MCTRGSQSWTVHSSSNSKEPLASAELEDLRVQHVVEFYPPSGVKIAAIETYYAPSSSDVESELELSFDEMLKVVQSEDLKALLHK